MDQAIIALVDWFTTNEKMIVLLITILVYVIGTVVYVILLYVPAVYGRYSTSTCIPLNVPARVAWFIQEAPSAIIPILVVGATLKGWIGPQFEVLQIVVLGAFIVHYIQRTFIYSLLISGGKPTPIILMFLAFTFTTANGYIQARGAVMFSSYSGGPLVVGRVVFGLAVFALGMVINIHSDYVLRNLRKPGETGYKIPVGGAFQLVSCANFFGEIMEWFGFAFASWSIVAFAFSFFTAANLVPRALAHHRWYLKKFEDYPKERKAVFPYIM